MLELLHLISCMYENKDSLIKIGKYILVITNKIKLGKPKLVKPNKIS